MRIRRLTSFKILKLALMLSASAMALGAEAPRAPGAFSDLTTPLEIVLERDPSRVAAATRLARLHAEVRNWEGAWRVLERSAPHAKKDAEYQGFCGTALRQLKRPNDAADAYRRAITLKPDDGRWWVGLGLALEDAGRRLEAKQAFAAARELEQTLPPALLKLAEKRR